jgi:hypothetical protein
MCAIVGTYEPYVRLAELLNSITPGDFRKKTLVSNSGAEAVENAVKLARVHTKQQGIPWFAILDGAGKVLARGDMASGGPIGFPYEEAEIETFAAMLAESATRLTPDDLGALKRSLAAVHERDERAKAERKAKEVPPEETKDTDDAETTEEQDG